MSATQPKAPAFETLEATAVERVPLPDISLVEDNPIENNPIKDRTIENRNVKSRNALNDDIEDQDIEQALSYLVAGDFHRRWDHAKQFVKRFLSDRPIPHLIDHLQRSTDPDHQWFLVRILGQYDRPIVVETLAQFLVTTPEAELQAETIKSLTNLGDSAIAALSQQLQAQPISQRRLAARALAQIRRSAVILPLLSIARDADSQLRLVAIEALGSFHDARITPVLISALADDGEIAIEAIRALGRRGDLLAEYDLVGLLQRCLMQGAEAIAKEAAIALGRLGTEEAAIALGVFLTQPAPTAVKVAAVRALSWLDSAIATAHLAIAFEHAPPVVMPTLQLEIARALGRTRAPANKQTAANPLIRWLRQTNEANRPIDEFALKQTIISSLTWLGETDAIESLIPLLADADARIQMHALSALKQIDPRDAKASVVGYMQARSLDSAVQNQLTAHLSDW